MFSCVSPVANFLVGDDLMRPWEGGAPCSRIKVTAINDSLPRFASRVSPQPVSSLKELAEMGVFSAFLLVLVVQLAASHPALQAKLDSVVDSNPCVKQCMKRIIDSKIEMNVAKTVDYAFYFLHLDEICDMVSSSKECIDQCGIVPNPFGMKHMTVMCTPESLRTTLAFAPCMREKGPEVMEDCKKSCGDVEPINEELSSLIEKIKKDNSDKVSLKAALLKTNEGCGVTKCFARCSREAYNKKCEDVVGVQAGEFLKAFIESSLQATRADLEQMNLVQVMAANTPPQCAYNYIPDLLFNVTADAETISVLEKHLPEVPTDLRAQASQEMYALQHEVLVRELAVLMKRDKILDKESLKLDLEIAALQKNAMNFL
uniref:CPG4 domain-containing protein n=1 Tax=Steinernema glaseri TaxID=37863 RepID=A0A1I8AF87_9BILA